MRGLRSDRGAAVLGATWTKLERGGLMWPFRHGRLAGRIKVWPPKGGDLP